jgi:23S rRNA (cytidine1920-2'-O)/16S rRNA (cytidine1409-2'-O)-methyltransferase
VARRSRLDVELVRRGLARSREHAAGLVADGRVTVAGLAAVKAATAVASDAAVAVSDTDVQLEHASAYVSRGGAKLAGLLDDLGADVPVIEGRRCLDAGASTGGFTDVLLRHGAAEVVAVDVGYGQLAWSLRNDERVRVLERTNVRTLTLDAVGAPTPSVVVADLSFISLRLVLPALRACSTADADFVLLVKPQFEAGRDAVPKGGVVRDPEVRARAVIEVAQTAETEGLGVARTVASRFPGPAGNVEYFLWLRSDAPAIDPETVRRVVAEGPQ